MPQSVSSERLLPDGRGPADAAESLWRDRRFVVFWAGQALSQLGSQVASLALSIVAVLLLRADELELGFLRAAGVAAFLLVGLPAGAWIDRLRKRRVMMAADVVRMLAVLLVPLLWWLEALQIWHLASIGLITGLATVFFDVSYQSVVPALVDPARVPDANSKLESTSQLARILGPAAAGWIVAWATAPFAIVATAATYLGSVVALGFMKDSEERNEERPRRPLREEVGEGLVWVFTHYQLRRIVATATASNLFIAIALTLTPILLLRTLGFSAAEVGLLSSLSALGGFVGALSSAKVIRWTGVLRTVSVGALITAISAVILALAAGVPSDWAFVVLAVQGIAAGYGTVLFNVAQVSYRQEVTPRPLLARMNASIRFCVWGVMPIASIVAGVLATWLSLAETLWLAAIGSVLATLPVVLRPFRAKSRLWGSDEIVG